MRMQCAHEDGDAPQRQTGSDEAGHSSARTSCERGAERAPSISQSAIAWICGFAMRPSLGPLRLSGRDQCLLTTVQK
jgi:hypothetical protein